MILRFSIEKLESTSLIADSYQLSKHQTYLLLVMSNLHNLNYEPLIIFLTTPLVKLDDNHTPK